MSQTSPEPVEDTRVSSLELFFDLVFVFAITQLTAVLVAETTLRGLVRVLLIFGVLWWIYGGYGWLTNSVSPQRPVIRLLLLVGMAGFLVIALSIPTAFEGDGAIFGVAYLGVVLLHSWAFTRSTHAPSATAILRIAPLNIVSALLLIVGGVLGGRAQYLTWTLAVAVQWATPLITPTARFRIRTGHIVERYGLLLIIALGESVVAIGVGVSGLPLDAALLGTAVLTLAVTATMWWMYFLGDEQAATRALEAAPEDRRPRIVLQAFFYAQVPMLIGVVAFAAGVKEGIGHPGRELSGPAALALAGGVCLYLLGDAQLRHAIGAGLLTRRMVAAGLALTTVLLGTRTAAVAELATLAAVLVGAVIVDRRLPLHRAAVAPA
jgi:low temperature requirement protein LtrA